jgi:hypothetical protein
MLSVKTQFIYLLGLWDESDMGSENDMLGRHMPGLSLTRRARPAWLPFAQGAAQVACN